MWLAASRCCCSRGNDLARCSGCGGPASEIGEYVSALANSAALAGKAFAYVAWGISDIGHEVVGTSFEPAAARVGNEELLRRKRIRPRRLVQEEAEGLPGEGAGVVEDLLPDAFL